MVKFEAMAKNLIERETLDADGIKLIMAGQELPPVAAAQSTNVDEVVDSEEDI
jgi:hypothetical protein